MYQRSSRGGFQNRSFNRSGSRGRRFEGAYIHESKFIKKALPVEAEVAFVPTISFASLPVHESLKRNILQAGFTIPTPIQDEAIMPLIEGKNVVGVANTGTGKTAAFLIPLIDKLIRDKSQRVIILVPTRELAVQIRDQMRVLTNSLGVYATLCIGGAYMREQIYELRRNPQFVIGTPGRITDFVDRGILNLATFQNVVLDEVDRMLDMGFINDIKYLLSKVPAQRQSMFFSATISPNIHTLIQTFVPNPLIISVKKQDTTTNVEQDIVRVAGGIQKFDMLENMLRKDAFKKVLIFGRTKFGVEKLSTSLFRKGFKVASIHGGKPQSKRNYAIRMFKENVVSILVATDVASRGIDIADITHVINFDKPATYEDYIHRIGRTGRAHNRGIALTFVE